MPDRLVPRRRVLLPHVAPLVAAALVALVGAPARAAPAAQADDFATLREQVVAHDAAGAPSARTVKEYIARLRDDGTWPDVDYASQRRGGWTTARHLGRVHDLARAYAKPGHPMAGSAEVAGAVRRALEHWVEKNYTNPNWWWMRIGMPRDVAPTLLLMGDALWPAAPGSVSSTAAAWA